MFVAMVSEIDPVILNEGGTHSITSIIGLDGMGHASQTGISIAFVHRTNQLFFTSNGTNSSVMTYSIHGQTEGDTFKDLKEFMMELQCWSDLALEAKAPNGKSCTIHLQFEDSGLCFDRGACHVATGSQKTTNTREFFQVRFLCVSQRLSVNLSGCVCSVGQTQTISPLRCIILFLIRLWLDKMSNSSCMSEQ